MPIYLQQMHNFQPYLVEGYRSALLNFARASVEFEQPLSPTVVISSAETLALRDREYLETTWKTRVFNRYGCREVGGIAHECEAGRMHMAADELIMETVGDDGTIQACGETGDVLITTLTNWVMPLIRYAIEDRAAFSNDLCSCGRGLPLIKHIQGRTGDILRLANGKKIDTLFFYHALKDYPIIEFQVEQLAADRCIVRLIPASHFTEVDREKITLELAKYLGPEIQLTVQCCEQLLSTTTGKYRRVIGYQEDTII